MTVVGHGLGEEPTLLRRSLSIASDAAGQPVPLQLGPLALTMIVPSGAVTETVRSLHAELIDS